MKYFNLFVSIVIFAACDSSKDTSAEQDSAMNSCDEYVACMCASVSQEECDELTTLYSDASSDQQNECAIALDEAEAAGGCGTTEM